MAKTPVFRTQLKRGFRFLFQLRSRDPDQRGRELILNTLLLSTIFFVAGVLIILFINLLIRQFNPYLPRLILALCVFIVLIALYWRFRQGSIMLPTIVLLGFYIISASGIAAAWSIINPTALLLFSFAIILSGILLGARYSLYTLFLVVGILSFLVFLTVTNGIHVDTSWTEDPSVYDYIADIVAFSIILTNVAVVSWLFNRSMNQSLKRAHRSEKALLRQKELLEVKVEERTRQLQEAHMVRMQELYRFAELGHMSTALLHDMANYLAVLSLDIEDLKQTKQNRSNALQRVQQSIRHLDSLTSQVRRQIKGEAVVSQFNIADEIDKVMKILEYKANAAHVTLEWQDVPDRSELMYRGSVNHFWQIMTNIISNSIDAYEGREHAERAVHIMVENFSQEIVILVIDHGGGISPAKQEKIFDPFYTTKKNGSGMGLSIARSMVQTDFGGTITVSSNHKTGTVFTVSLPRHGRKKA